MTTFANLAEAMDRFNEALNQEAENRMRSTGKVALRTVVRRTPVDTAKARSNWIVTNNRPTRRQRPGPFRPRSRAGIGERANANAAIQAGDRVIDSFRLGKFTILGSKTIFIQNNTDYIETLDNGFSSQAPAGFSDLAVQAALKEANRFRVKF